MDSDKHKQPSDVSPEKSDAEVGPVKDEGWAKVDLHDEKNTPEADIPSDIEPS